MLKRKPSKNGFVYKSIYEHHLFHKKTDYLHLKFNTYKHI